MIYVCFSKIRVRVGRICVRFNLGELVRLYPWLLASCCFADQKPFAWDAAS